MPRPIQKRPIMDLRPAEVEIRGALAQTELGELGVRIATRLGFALWPQPDLPPSATPSQHDLKAVEYLRDFLRQVESAISDPPSAPTSRGSEVDQDLAA